MFLNIVIDTHSFLISILPINYRLRRSQMVLKYYFEFSFFLSLTEWWLPCVTQKISLVFSSVLGIVQWIQRRNVMYGETDIFFENMSTKYFVMAASLYKTQSHHWWHRENRTICVACRLDCKGTLAGKKEETKWRASMHDAVQ